MNESQHKQRLAAILAADAAGYSRLMADDERATVVALDSAREVFRSHIDANHGRVIDTAGDSVLAVFEAASGAITSALEIQAALSAMQEAMPEERRMRFRIGLHLGDVIEKADGSVYGDGVNIAARLQALAAPGGITVSGSLREAARNRVAVNFEDLGEQTVKNIAAPVRVFRIAIGNATAQAPSVARAPAGPNKPSIAVLPFTNMSGDAQQEYFADGIVEDIITELSRYSELFVIARNSTFTYKGRNVKVQDVRRDLGVHYVVEGSVRRAGNRVRVTVQLIDAATGAHIWAERYDRDFVDLFELQDELTRAIVATLPGRLGGAEEERLRRKPPSDMAAFDYLIAGKILHHRGTKEDNAEALRLLEKAIELDPRFAQAYAWKACVIGQAMVRGYKDNPKELKARAVEAIHRAVALDADDVECHRLMCEITMGERQFDQAMVHNERALRLNPNDPRIVAQRGELLIWLGRPGEGEEWLKKASKLDPHGDHTRTHLLGRALFGLRRYAEALEAFKRVGTLRYDHHAAIAACYAQLGQDAEAREQTEAVLRLKPEFSTRQFVQALSYRSSSDNDHVEEAMRKAGLPE